MRSSFTATTGLKLTRSPNARDQAARRWALLATLIAGLAAAGAIFGTLTAPPSGGETAARTGPFSYFPSE